MVRHYLLMELFSNLISSKNKSLKKLDLGPPPPRLTLENVQALAKKVPQTVWIWLPPPFLEKVQARAEKSSLKFLIWV